LRSLLAAIVVTGALARFWNLDFDQRQHQHPDERHWSITSDALSQLPPTPAHGTVFGPVLDWLDADRSPAAPYRATESFVYGPAPLAWSRGAAAWLDDGAREGTQPASAVVHLVDSLGVPLLDPDGVPRFDDRYEVDLIGRVLGALADTLTILVIAAIGRRIRGWGCALVAAALYAGCVMAVQHAHYLGSEPFVTLGGALVLLAGIRLHRGHGVVPSLRTGAVLGLASGTALAMKLSALPVVAIAVAACAFLVVRHRRRSDVARFAAVVVGAYVAFRVLNPGAFDGLGLVPSSHYLDDVANARAMQQGDLPPAVQWANRAVWEPFRWMLVYTLGPGLVLLAGIGALGLVAERRWGLSGVASRWVRGLLLGSAGAQLVVIGLSSVPTGRYVMPALPALCVLGGVGAVALWNVAERLASRAPRPAAAVRIAVGASLALSALWALAFVAGVHGREHTRIEASRWIAANVPPGSVVSSQAWDDSLPLRLPGVDTAAFPIEQLVLVGTDTEAKIGQLADQLQRIDYVVESSPRLWATVVRIPQRFGSSIRFFEALDDGSIGFERVATFETGPQLGPFRLDSSNAEEAFSVYDHPEVRIWRKVAAVPADEIIERLDPVAAATALDIVPAAAGAEGLLLDPGVRAELETGPSYDATFDENGSGALHALGWLALLTTMACATWIVLLPVMRSLPDAGLGTSWAIGLVLTAFGSFVATTWWGLDLGRPQAGAAIGALLLVAALAWPTRRAEVTSLLRQRRTLLIGALATPIVVGGLTLLLRAANPDLWHPDRGGEKPFELAVLTSVLRSDTLAPYDAWFSNGRLNYYYGGYLMLQAPARLLGTTPSLVMNIGLAAVVAAAAGGAWTIGAALVARSRNMRPDQTRVVAGAAVAVGLLLVAANVDTVAPAWSQLLGTGDDFDWWARSRVIPESVAITEFPAWSVLFGDLHPHVIGLGVLLALGASCLALHDRLLAGRRTAWAAAVLVGVLVGQVRATNTWDLLLAVSMVVVAFGAALVQRAQVRTTVVAAVIVAGVVIVGWRPYTRQTQVFDQGVDPGELFTPWVSWLQQFGFFVAVSLLALAAPARRSIALSARSAAEQGRRVPTVLPTAVGVALVGVGVALVLPDRTVAVCCALLAGALCWAALSMRTVDLVPAFAFVVIAGGWTIQFFVESFTIRNDGGRQNTVFKFWYQSWLLLAVGSAAVLVWLLADLRLRHEARPVRRATARLAALLVAAIAVTSLGFWAFALPPRLDDRISTTGLSLDGEAFLDVPFEITYAEVPLRPGDDLPLVHWLRAHVDGVQVVSEIGKDDYRWSGRISVFTGLPTPIGWAYHQSQQRRDYQRDIDRRVAAMDALYTSTDPGVIARSLADDRVAYVVFGTVERSVSTPESEAALRSHPCLTIEVESAGLFIASVDPACVRSLRPLG
jgi:YYY domain-containing protein